MPEQSSGITNINPAGNNKSKRKVFWYWSLVIIAAMAAATLVLVNAIKPEDAGIIEKIRRTQKEKPHYELVSETKVEGKFDQDSFSKNLPIISGSNTKSQTAYSLSNGWKKYVVTLESTNAVNSIYIFYRDYLAKNDWAILERTENKQITAATIGMLAEIVINKKTDFNEIVINLTITGK